MIMSSLRYCFLQVLYFVNSIKYCLVWPQVYHLHSSSWWRKLSLGLKGWPHLPKPCSHIHISTVHNSTNNKQDYCSQISPSPPKALFTFTSLIALNRISTVHCSTHHKMNWSQISHLCLLCMLFVWGRRRENVSICLLVQPTIVTRSKGPGIPLLLLGQLWTDRGWV